ncbi:hypothetical protein LAZ67_18002203 [Cordylochernes scorpioides]|uniref:Uncharacterized protein n=1 Tax=Cordylochernes scorpioides TaxID=51811 RepID=A0ABY6LHC1_9ARAC|nr:hypothetical protein LAZ67_18002203 [Cordylochernes scorpioides]
MSIPRPSPFSTGTKNGIQRGGRTTGNLITSAASRRRGELSPGPVDDPAKRGPGEPDIGAAYKALKSTRPRRVPPEGVTRSLNHLETLKVRNAAVQILSRPSQIPPSNNRHRQIIKKLQSYKSLIFIKADKGSHTVVLDRSDYLSKMTDILQDNTTFSSISPQENLALTKSFRKALCEMKKSSIITPDQFVLFTSCLDREAYIYGLPKIHKPGSHSGP